MSLYLTEKTQGAYNKLTERFHQALYEKEGEIALSYLKEERKFSEKSIRDFQIGYFPSYVNFENNKILNNLKQRVIFPIIDEFGDTNAFSGRFPLKDVKDKRWWHENYAKSFSLFGINLAWKHILKKKFVYIVEGQADVISCHQHGLKNTIGTMGSSLTDEQIAKISMFATNFVFLFDADEAGLKASEKSALSLTQKDINQNIRGYDFFKIILKTEDRIYDPDEFLKNFGPQPIIHNLKKQKEEKQKKKEKDFWDSLLN